MRMRNIMVAALGAVIATASLDTPAFAQGLLGALLNGHHSQLSGSRQSKLDFVTELQLRGSQWVVENQSDRGSGYQSPFACMANLSSDARLILSDSAARTLSETYIFPNAVLVKDGAEPDAPVWKISVLTCGNGEPRTDSPLDAATASAFSASGVDPNDLLTKASEYVRQVDGSFPPPPTRAEMAQNQLNKKYVFTVADYDPNGNIFQIRFGTVFDTADECGHYVGVKLAILAVQVHALVLGGSVLVPADASGYSWLGCLHPQDTNSAASTSYLSVKMNAEQARRMKRFPDFSTPPANPPSQRGRQVKI